MKDSEPIQCRSCGMACGGGYGDVMCKAGEPEPSTEADGCSRDDSWDHLTPAEAYAEGWTDGQELLKPPIQQPSTESYPGELEELRLQNADLKRAIERAAADTFNKPSREAAGFDTDSEALATIERWWRKPEVLIMDECQAKALLQTFVIEALNKAYTAGQSSSLEGMLENHNCLVGKTDGGMVRIMAYPRNQSLFDGPLSGSADGTTLMEAVTALLEQIEDNNNAA